MTTEVYKKLKQYETKFQTAVYSNFVRFTSTELNAFNEILKEHDGKGLTNSQRTCPRCLLNAIKTVAAEYYKFKDSPWGKRIEKQEKDANDGDTADEEKGTPEKD